MNDVINRVNLDTKWKYCLPHDIRWFDSRRYTQLATYISHIFPETEFQYNVRASAAVGHPNSHDMSSSICYEVPAICPKLKLAILYRGESYYQNMRTYYDDNNKVRLLEGLGYQVVILPYWLPLSRDVVLHKFAKFRVNILEDDTMCELHHPMYDGPHMDCGLSSCVGSFHEFGRNMFVQEFGELPPALRRQVLSDIDAVRDHAGSKYTIACPNYVYDQLRLLTQ